MATDYCMKTPLNQTTMNSIFTTALRLRFGALEKCQQAGTKINDLKDINQIEYWLSSSY